VTDRETNRESKDDLFRGQNDAHVCAFTSYNLFCRLFLLISTNM